MRPGILITDSPACQPVQYPLLPSASSKLDHLARHLAPSPWERLGRGSIHLLPLIFNFSGGPRRSTLPLTARRCLPAKHGATRPVGSLSPLGLLSGTNLVRYPYCYHIKPIYKSYRNGTTLLIANHKDGCGISTIAVSLCAKLTAPRRLVHVHADRRGTAVLGPWTVPSILTASGARPAEVRQHSQYPAWFRRPLRSRHGRDSLCWPDHRRGSESLRRRPAASCGRRPSSQRSSCRPQRQGHPSPSTPKSKADWKLPPDARRVPSSTPFAEPFFNSRTEEVLN